MSRNQKLKLNKLRQKKLFNSALGLAISLIAFAITLGSLSARSPSSSSLATVKPEAVFTAADSATRIKESQAKGKGIFHIGEFALFQLADNSSDLQLTKVAFDPDTKIAVEADAKVNKGSVLAVNLLFGPQLKLNDQNIEVTNRGGSFILEAKKDSSRVEVFSGSAKVLVHSPENKEKTFEAVLTSKQEVLLDQTSLANLFASDDALQQAFTWKELVKKTQSRFDGENILISKFINDLPNPEEKTAISDSLDNFKKNLLFSPVAKKNFYWQQIQAAFGKVVAGEKTATAAYFAEVPDEEKTVLKTVASATTGYTRIFIPENLSPKIKNGVIRLATSFPQLKQFTGVSDLDTEATLMRNLAFVNADPAEEKYAESFLEQALASGSSDHSELIAQLLKLFSSNKKVANQKWIANYQQLNALLATSQTGLAEAIINQLKLANILINSNQGNLGSEALHGLAVLISESADKFQPELLEKIAMQGNDLKNRIAFLASNHSAASDIFDEEGYKKWLADQNGETTLENPKIEEVQITPEEENALSPTENLEANPTDISVVELVTPDIEVITENQATENETINPEAPSEATVAPMDMFFTTPEPQVETSEKPMPEEVITPNAGVSSEDNSAKRVSRPINELDKFLKLLAE